MLVRIFGDSVRSIAALIAMDALHLQVAEHVLVADAERCAVAAGIRERIGFDAMLISCWRTPSTRSVCS